MYTIAGDQKCLKMIHGHNTGYGWSNDSIPLNQTDLYCDPSTTKLPLPKSEQENNDYHAAFWDMLQAVTYSLLVSVHMAKLWLPLA